MTYHREIKFSSELGGGKGWPPDANVVLYHHTTVYNLLFNFISFP